MNQKADGSSMLFNYTAPRFSDLGSLFVIHFSLVYFLTWKAKRLDRGLAHYPWLLKFQQAALFAFPYLLDQSVHLSRDVTPWMLLMSRA